VTLVTPHMNAPSTEPSGPLEQTPMPMLAGQGPTPTRVFGFNLLMGPAAATEARHALMAAEDTLGEEERQPMLLTLTELVTNAIRHGGAVERPDGLAVKVVESDGGVGAAVTNPGEGFSWSGRASDDPLEPGGYGLMLVDSMSSRWGIQRQAGNTTVWFELDRATG
jgi:anti-sigma regulatory factor (Ser/Thr protein kinase)